jgi:hypothetical protein
VIFIAIEAENPQPIAQTWDARATFRDVKAMLHRIGRLNQGRIRFFSGGSEFLDDAIVGDAKGIVDDIVLIKEDSIYSKFHDQMFHWDSKDRSRYGKPRHHGVLPLKTEKMFRFIQFFHSLG